MTVSYYGAALKDGKISQLLVTRENGKEVSKEWTGKMYKTMAECEADLSERNRHLSTLTSTDLA